MQIAAGQFKARCLKLMDEVQTSREEVIITKRSKPIAKLVPFEEAPLRPLFGFLQGTVAIHDDLTAPLDEHWDVDEVHT